MPGSPRKPKEDPVLEVAPNPFDKVRADRVARLEHLGFRPESAELLADAMGHDGIRVSIVTIQRALMGGCTHDQALVIFA